jgi:RNA polymerase sigma factor (sigma-70 family)
VRQRARHYSVTVTDVVVARFPHAEVVRTQLEVFVGEEYAAVVAAVRLITGDREGAADSVQDAIVRLLAHPPAEPVRNVAAWVTVVASNRSRDRFRRQQAERRAIERLDLAEAYPSADAHISDPQVLDAVRSLPLGQRQTCILFYFLDLPVAAIAEELDVSIGTIKTQLFRARKALAESLAPANVTSTLATAPSRASLP